MLKSLLVSAVLFATACSFEGTGLAPDGDGGGGPVADTDAGEGEGEGDGNGNGNGGQDDDELPPCATPGLAIVSDIDETLTTSDLEWLTQMVNGNHDPAERASAAELITAYAERGYFILYLTSRPADTTVGFTGESATDATRRWLEEHGFPIDPERTKLQLSPGLVFGDSSADYKAGALADLQDQGFTFDWAYGNATSDIAAYATAGIPKERTFIIGAQAGTENTVAVEAEGYEEHIDAHLPGVEPVCTAD